MLARPVNIPWAMKHYGPMMREAMKIELKQGKPLPLRGDLPRQLVEKIEKGVRR